MPKSNLKKSTFIFLSLLILVSCFQRNDPYNPKIIQPKNLQEFYLEKNSSCNSNKKPVALDFVTSARIGLCVFIPDKSDKATVYLSPRPDGLKKKIATINKGENSALINNLSPGTDVFLTVNFYPQNKQHNLRVKTQTFLPGLGGQLDTMVREIFLVRNDVLALVLAREHEETKENSRVWINKFGTQIEKLLSNNWSIQRQNNKKIEIKKIHRFSKAVNMPDRVSPRDMLVDIDHTLYFKLAEPIGNEEILTIKSSENLSIIFPFSDYFSQTPAISINQVGYMPTPLDAKNWQRYAYLSQWIGDGGSLKYSSHLPENANAVVADSYSYEMPKILKQNGDPILLPISKRDGVDTPDSSDEVMQIDLAMLPQSETKRYRIYIPQIGVSYETGVSHTAVYKAFFAITRALYKNRWGRIITKNNSNWSPFYPDHSVVYFPPKSYRKNNHFFEKNTPFSLETAVPLSGGHHDAGDYDIRPQHVQVAYDLLAAYETNPAAFSDGQLNIPESQNGIPDLLDEAIWNLNYLLQLQNSDGSIHNGVETYAHPQIGYAHDDLMPYFIHNTSLTKTIISSALFAWAARLLYSYDLAWAATFETAALRAWKYALGNKNDTNKIPACAAYATGHLYSLTEKDIYKKAFEEYFKKATFVRRPLSGTESINCKVGSLEFTYGYLMGPDPSDKILNDIKRRVKDLSMIEWNQLQNNYAFRHPRKYEGTCSWGTCTTPLKSLFGTALFAYFHNNIEQLSPEDYFRNLNTLSLSADTVFGVNPASMSYTTGLGSKMPSNLLHMDSIAYQNEHGLEKGPAPGFTVYGPMSSWSRARYYHKTIDAFYPELAKIPHALRDADVVTNVIGREFSVHGVMAPSARHMSLLLTPGMTMPQSWLPNGENSKQTTPVLSNNESIFSNEPLKITKIKSISNDTIKIFFSSAIKDPKDNSTINIALEPAYEIEAFKIDRNKKSITLKTKKLKEGPIKIKIKGLKPKNNLQNSDQALSFNFSYSSKLSLDIKILLENNLKTFSLPPENEKPHLSRINGLGREKKNGLSVTRVLLLDSEISFGKHLPNDISIEWKQVKGPKNKTVLSAQNAPRTPILFKEPGDYVFSLCIVADKVKKCDTVSIKAQIHP